MTKEEKTFRREKHMERRGGEGRKEKKREKSVSFNVTI